MGDVLQIMAARSVMTSGVKEQEPYEYTDVSSYDQLIVHINLLYCLSTAGAWLYFKTGNYRRADYMKQIHSVQLTTSLSNSIIVAVLGRDGVANTQLGAWLSVAWESDADDRYVVGVSALAR